MLKDTGFRYEPTRSNSVWTVNLDRKNMGKVRVIISAGSGIVVTFAIVAQKANINKSLQFLDALASFNHEYDYAKIGLDKDQDLFVRIDMPTRILDGEALKDVILQIADASDEVYAKVKDSIKH